MSEEPIDPRRGCMLGFAHWAAFAMSIPLMTCGITLAVLVMLVLDKGLDPTALANLGNPQDLMTPGFMGVTSIVQAGSMALTAAGLALLLPRREGLTDLWSRLRDALALRKAAPEWVVAGAVGTLTVGMLPGWVASRMMEMPAFAAWAESMGMIGELLSNTSDPGWFAMAVAVAVSAPVFEELIFRGYLWRAAELALPPMGVWLLTSVAFASFHGNPIQVAAVLPIGMLFGWLRLQSGSIWPSMLAHAVNNTLALAMTLWAGTEQDAPLGWAITGFLATLAVVAGAHIWARQRSVA